MLGWVASDLINTLPPTCPHLLRKAGKQRGARGGGGEVESTPGCSARVRVRVPLCERATSHLSDEVVEPPEGDRDALHGGHPELLHSLGLHEGLVLLVEFPLGAALGHAWVPRVHGTLPGLVLAGQRVAHLHGGALPAIVAYVPHDPCKESVCLCLCLPK